MMMGHKNSEIYMPYPSNESRMRFTSRKLPLFKCGENDIRQHIKN